MSPPVIEIRDMSFSYGESTVLSHVNLEIPQGEFAAVIGPNGGGKTTLVKLILGLLTPDQGTIRVLGQAPRLARNHIGYMPQRPTGQRDLPIKVLDMVLTGLLDGWRLGLRWSRKEKGKAMEALRLVGMEDQAGRQAGSLSGGQLQRVMLARALVCDPEILLLDEPMANIDMGGQGILFDLLARLNEKMTILMVTHDMGLLSRHVKSVICVNRTVYFHDSAELSPGMIEALGLTAEGCPLEMVAHGVPHRVLSCHGEHCHDRCGKREPE